MIKLFVVSLCCFLFFSGCAGQQIKYEPRPFSPPSKVLEYKLPKDPFAGTEPPKAIFLAPSGNFWKEVAKQDAILIAYSYKEHEKIVLRLGYFKELVPQLENLINIHIRRENVLIDIIVDQNLLKEINREMLVTLQNKVNSDEFWNKVEKFGHWTVILGLLIEVGLLAL